MFLQTPVNKILPSGNLNQSLLMKTASNNDNMFDVRSSIKSQTGQPGLIKSTYSKSFGELKYSTTQKSNQREILSEIGESDQWAEITKFQQEKEQERQRLERLAKQQRKKDIKEVLQSQLKERQKEYEKKMTEQREYETQLLQKVKEEEQDEKKKVIEKKQKIVKEKYQRDVMLMEFEAKKRDTFKKEMVSEADYLQKLKDDLELERE